MLKMICGTHGYAIVEDGETLLLLSVEDGQPIYHRPYRSPAMPEVESIYLRGIVDGFAQASTMRSGRLRYP